MKLTVPEKHQLKIARRTLELSEAGANALGGPNHAEAREIIQRLTHKTKQHKLRKHKR